MLVMDTDVDPQAWFGSPTAQRPLNLRLFPPMLWPVPPLLGLFLRCFGSPFCCCRRAASDMGDAAYNVITSTITEALIADQDKVLGSL